MRFSCLLRVSCSRSSIRPCRPSILQSASFALSMNAIVILYAEDRRCLEQTRVSYRHAKSLLLDLCSRGRVHRMCCWRTGALTRTRTSKIHLTRSCPQLRSLASSLTPLLPECGGREESRKFPTPNKASRTDGTTGKLSYSRIVNTTGQE